MFTITKKLEFDAGHRVYGHETKCKYLHGHRYVAEITVEADDLDPLSRVIDFSVIKTIVGGWINQYWDHNILLHPEDPLLKAGSEVFQGRKPFVMPPGQNPTAEAMARVLAFEADRLLPETISVVSVQLWETPTCSSYFELDFVSYKLLEDFPRYKVGDDGTVWSLRRGKWKKLSAGTLSNEYKQVRLCNEEGYRDVLVHRLVLECFVGPCPKGHQACHNDGDRSNNDLSNLRWDTPAGNNRDKLKHGTQQVGQKHPMAKLTDELVLEIRSKYDSGTHSLSQLAEEYGVCSSNIRWIVKRLTWSHLN